MTVSRHILAAALALSLSAAVAAEPILARVLAVAPRSVTLSLEGTGPGPATRVDVPVTAEDLPDGVAAGRLVRVWPGPHGLAGGARLVPLDTDLGGADRTGVRARLMHGAGRGFGGGRGGH
jgi:hypothetical protein